MEERGKRKRVGVGGGGALMQNPLQYSGKWQIWDSFWSSSRLFGKNPHKNFAQL